MEYKIIYSDELYHYGVKGMKWGVRNDRRVAAAESRYQNATKDAKQARREAKSFSRRHAISSRIDGSKNNQKAAELRRNAEKKSKIADKAKDKLDRTTNLVKNERYRDLLANSAKKRAEWEVENAKEAQSNITDLKKHGTRADIYKEQRAEALSDQKSKYEERFGKDSYDASWASLADAIHYDWNSTQRVSDMIKSERVDRDSHINTARRYMNKRKALMDMPISELTTKREVKNLYNNAGTLKSAGADTFYIKDGTRVKAALAIPNAREQRLNAEAASRTAKKVAGDNRHAKLQADHAYQKQLFDNMSAARASGNKEQQKYYEELLRYSLRNTARG